VNNINTKLLFIEALKLFWWSLYYKVFNQFSFKSNILWATLFICLLSVSSPKFLEFNEDVFLSRVHYQHVHNVNYTTFEKLYFQSKNYNVSLQLVCSEYVILKKLFSRMNPDYFCVVLLHSYRLQIPVITICSVIHEESRGNPNAVSCSGAVGLMQLMPEYHSNSNSSILRIPSYNIMLGSQYLKYCFNSTDAYNSIRAYKNYNSGPNSNFYNWPYIARILHHEKNYFLYKINSLHTIHKEFSLLNM